MSQLNAEMYTEGCSAFVEKLAEITGYSVDDLYTFDVLFGKTVKQKELGLIKVDETGLDITSDYGMELKSGSNGNFGDAPFAGTVASQEWADQAIAFFDGTFSDEIFDLDQHKIDFCSTPTILMMSRLLSLSWLISVRTSSTSAIWA